MVVWGSRSYTWGDTVDEKNRRLPVEAGNLSRHLYRVLYIPAGAGFLLHQQYVLPL